MKRLLLLLSIAGLVAAPAAQAQVPVGGFTSDGVEFVKNIPQHFDTAGGRLHEGYYYVTTERDLSIYDVKDPENPVRVGNVLLDTPGTPVFTEEDPDTNGEILLVSNVDLLVYDVSDKANPTLLSTLPGFDEHTVSCVLDCTWAYGSEGGIVDLRDPTSPKLVDSPWAPDLGQTHDVTEVSPGIVLTATDPMLLLDARTNPEAPTVLATTPQPGFTHATLWPHAGTDDFALVGGESTGPGCSNGEDASATFQTYDTRGWQGAGAFRLVDQFAMSTGLPPQGASPESTYCVHWFDTHPTYANGGLLSIAWYEHGVRFLGIGGDGKITEVGWYVPLGGQSSDTDWISDEIVYVADYVRGLDILRFTGPIPQGRGRNASGGGGSGGGGEATPPRSSASFDDLVKLPSARRCATRKSLAVRIRRTRGDDGVTRATLSVNGRRQVTAKGRKLRKPLRLRKLPRKAFSLQVLVRTRSGHETAGQRRYRVCGKRKR